MDAGEGSSTGVWKESNTQSSMEWPTDCFLEEPGPIHQEWPMNSQFDLNLDLQFDSQFDPNLDCNFQGSEKAPIDLNEEENGEASDNGYDFYKSDDSGKNVDVEGHIELEPELFPISDADVDEVDDLEELNKAAMARAARMADSKAKATKARKLKQKMPPQQQRRHVPVPPQQQRRHVPVPPQQQRRPAPVPPPVHRPVHSSSQHSGVTGRPFQSSGSHLGPCGYENSRLYSYFTAGLGHDTQESSTSQQE